MAMKWSDHERQRKHREQRLRELGVVVKEARAVVQRNVCPVCGKYGDDVKDRMFVRSYVPGQSDNSHIVSCGKCFEELEQEGEHS